LLKDSVILLSPESPQDHRADRHPRTTNLVELSRDPIGEYPLFPRKGPPRTLSIAPGDQSIHDMNAPLPGMLGREALPKTVQQ
jgi:hypothetical protein